MPPLPEDEFDESSDAREDEVDNNTAEDVGEDGQNSRVFEEEDDGVSRTSYSARSESGARGGDQHFGDTADASNAESESDEASVEEGSKTEAVGAVKMRPADG